SEDEDEGGTGNDDEPHPDPFAMGPSPPDFLDAGEAAGPALSTLLPFAPFAEESAPDTPGPRRDQPARRPRIVRALRRAHDDVETPSRPVPVPRRAPQLRPGPAGPRSSSRLGMIVKRGAPVVRRSF